jgi:hypothetical protein
MRLQIIRKPYHILSAEERIEIDNFVGDNNGLIFHETVFNYIIAKTFQTQLAFALAYAEGRLVAVCPIHTIKNHLLKQSFSNPSQYEAPYGGWVVSKEMSLQPLIAQLPLAFNESLTCWTPVLSNSAEELNVSSSCKEFASALIELSKSEQTIWEEDIHSKRRNMVRKAEKTGIRVQTGGLDQLDSFYPLLLDMNNKAGIHSQCKDFYEKILNNYYPGQCVILLAYSGAEIVGGTMLVGNQNAIHYWQGATKAGVGNNGQGELLQWEGIKWSKGANSKFYDLCVIEQERLPHIARFKSDFSRQLVPFFCVSRKNIFFRLINRIQHVFPF